MSSSKLFKKQGYVTVRRALNSDLRDLLTQYALFDEMQNFTPERVLYPDTAQVRDAHSKYADPAMEALLLHMQPTIERVTGLRLHPTYSFFRVYRNGDELLPHIDRPSCEISATVCLNHSYVSANLFSEIDLVDALIETGYSWPIIIQGTKVHMNPGDLVVYKGMELTHWRDAFLPPEDSWHVQAFLHYVDQDGPFFEWKYDKRQSLGVVESFKSSKNYIQYL